MNLRVLINLIINTSLMTLLSLLMSACESQVEDFELSEPQFITRSGEAGGEECSYRIVTYSTSNVYKDDHIGSYIGMPGAVMTPQILDEEGNQITATEDEHKSAAISGIAESRKVICVSPGIMPNDDGTFNVFANLKPYYFSDNKTWTLGKMSKYNFEKITDRRAKINIKIAIDPSNTQTSSIEVSQLEIMGVGGKGYDGNYSPSLYYPITRQVKRTMNSHVVDMVDKYEMADDGSEEVVNTPKTIYINKEDIFVPSAIYAPKEIVRQKIKAKASDYLIDSNYIYIVFNLRQDSNVPVKITQVLTDVETELEPLCVYTFTFMIKSRHYSVSLEKTKIGNDSWDWEEENLGDQPIGGIGHRVTIDLGTWPIGVDCIENWENHNDGEQTI